MAAPKSKSTRVTLIDVARKSGFSPSTVSIVLSEAPLSRYVAAKTKERIRKTAQSLGYRPDVFARSLRSRRSHTVGVLVFDISDPFCVLILRGIEKTLQSTSYLPILMDAHHDRKQFEGYLELLMERRVEGLIVVANWLFDEGGLLEALKNKHMPTVVVGRDVSEKHIGSVIVDNEAGGYIAIKHLYELGHRRIAVIRGPRMLSDSNRRWSGIQRFAAEQGLQLDERVVRELPGAIDPFSGFEGGAQLTEELLQSRSKFTALVAFDDLTALGAIRALAREDRSAPRDCSIIGFDDVPLAALSTPGITTIRQPMEQMGSAATNRLLEVLRESSGSGQVSTDLELLPPSLVLRDSTSRLA
ncbi:MAG: LacI family DNA-binding transcriptional regulator [Silvibacterium sp.]|nr:LacI family DNA-binding transcriptional regulator [Silvibacterium sp.]MBV8435906.1 LacI family DNA-binding transcriptional regulator [Silvibacterium sp.]